MRFDDRKLVLSPEEVELLPEFAPLNDQQKSLLLLIASGLGFVAATQAVYECKDIRSARSFAYELMRRRTLQPVLNQMYQKDDKTQFMNRVDELVRRGHKVTDAELNGLLLYGALHNFLPPDFSLFTSFAGADHREAKRKFETAYLKGKLEDHGWNVSKAAASMGLQRTSLQVKLRGLGIQRPAGKAGDIENE